MSFFQELKRRNVFRVALAYLITAWLVMQVGVTMVPALHLPVWVNSLLALLLILGFPIAMFFAWAFDLTPDGIKRDQHTGPQKSNRGQTNRKLERVLMVVMVLALGYLVADKFVLPPAEKPQPVTETIANIAEETASDKSIAVLPFVNLSSDPEQEYFSDGLTEELLNLLADITELKVAARTSSFFYKDKLDTIPLTTIARELEVTHVLEGSVRRSGSKIRITAQLIKADDGFHLWSETYDRDLHDIFAIQDEIAVAVTESLRLTLLDEVPRTRVLNMESYELTMEARYLFKRRDEGDLQLALEKFERAFELDAGNATAWLGAAPLYLWLNDPPDTARSVAAAQRAVDLEPDNPEAHLRLYVALLRSGEKGPAIDNEWVLAKKLGKQNALIQSVDGGREWDQGNFEKSIELQKRGIALDPLSITSRVNLASHLILLDRLEEAEEQVQNIFGLFPQNAGGLQTLANIRLLQGKPEQALQLVNQLGQGFQPGNPGDRKLQYQAMIYYSLGRHEEANNALASFIEKYRGLENGDIAIIYAWRGDPDKAFEWLNRIRDPDIEILAQLRKQSFLKSLHGDPRWDSLMEKWATQQSNE